MKPILKIEGRSMSCKPGAIQQSGLFPAKEKQRKRLLERKDAKRTSINIYGLTVDVYPGVYQTSLDTLLICESVVTNPTQRVLEIGCGCGAASLVLAKKSKSVLGVDINSAAVQNSIANASTLKIENCKFIRSDVFTNVEEKYDVIIFNPPYNRVESIVEDHERMFWDPNDESKIRFFEEVSDYLTSRGRVYFGWANFADLDTSMPLRLAQRAGLRYLRHYTRFSQNGAQAFYLLEFVR